MKEKQNIFYQFCEYVNETIFKANIGSKVSFIIDQSYILSFCEKYDIEENILLNEARKKMYRHGIHNVPILHIMGVVAIQVYAATKRADDYLKTKANYRDRLAELIAWDTAALQSWMQEYQDSYWKQLYAWCDKHHYDIAKSYPYYGKGRFVQYPIQQAERVFTNDELLYIAYAFVENKLYPDDNITFNEFWKIINWHSLYSYIRSSHSSHAENLYRTSEYYDDAKSQIFNYFLRWNGDYKHFSKISNIRQDDLYIYMNDELDSVDVRNEKLELVRKFPLSSFNHQTYICNKDLFPIRRNELILFKRDDTYENYWQETRYLEGEEDGLVIIFTDISSRWKLFPNSDLVKVLDNVRIYIVRKNIWTQDLYQESRIYRLEGGLKVGRRSYIHGGAPIFYIDEKCIFWIDDKLCSAPTGRYTLNHLSVGYHKIRVVGYKDIEIEIIDSLLNSVQWSDDNNQWWIEKKNAEWRPMKISNGIIGMNMKNICQLKHLNSNKIPTLSAWARTHNNIETDNQNIIIKTLKKIHSHEQF